VLKAQQAELPKKRAELAVMRTQIPDNPALPTLIRDLTAAGRKVGASIDSMAPALPVPAVAAAPAVATAETTGTAESTGEEGTTPAAPAAPPAPSLYQVPLTLNVSGSYFELEQFINKLEGLKRSFLVTGFPLSPATGGDAAAASTSTEPNAPAPGDLTLALQGRVFLAPTTAPATAPAATTQPAPAATTATAE